MVSIEFVFKEKFQFIPQIDAAHQISAQSKRLVPEKLF